MENIDVVVHAAGLAHQFKGPQDPAAFYEHNVLATRRVAEAASEAGVRRFVLVSSVSVFGRGDARLRAENAPCHPRGPYAQSKLEAEQEAIRAVRTTDMAMTVLRVATLYGEGDPGNVQRLLRALENGRFFWIGAGANLKSLLHVDDAARGCVLALLRPQPPGTVEKYIVSGPPCTMREIVGNLEAALGKKAHPVRVPKILPLAAAWGAARLTLGYGPPARWYNAICKWLENDAYDGSRFMKDVGFQPTISLREGLAREVAWRRAA